MAPEVACLDHRAMTTEQPIDQPIDGSARSTTEADAESTVPPDGAPGDAPYTRARPSTIRRLRRRTSDRVLGGVAAGLGDYLDVDPILIRAGFAGLMVFGGAGLALYGLGWLLIPDAGTDDSIAQNALRLMAQRTGRLGALFLVVLGVVVLSPLISNGYGGLYIQPEIFWALAIALIGVVLLLPRAERAEPGAQGLSQGGDPADVAPPSAPAYARRPPRVRERSPLGWYVVAAVLLIVGILGAIDIATPVTVLPGQYFGAGFLVLGLGLVVGSWWGNARGLILLGLVLAPAGFVSAFLTVPLEGGFGYHAYQPQNMAELETNYRLVGGELWLDLTALPAGTAPVSIAASAGVGRIWITVPKDATVQVAGTVEGGRLDLFGREAEGTALEDHVTDAGSGTLFVLDLRAGLGTINVQRSTSEGN